MGFILCEEQCLSKWLTCLIYTPAVFLVMLHKIISLKAEGDSWINQKESKMWSYLLPGVEVFMDTNGTSSLVRGVDLTIVGVWRTHSRHGICDCCSGTCLSPWTNQLEQGAIMIWRKRAKWVRNSKPGLMILLEEVLCLWICLCHCYANHGKQRWLISLLLQFYRKRHSNHIIVMFFIKVAIC